jgi:hypothetical protein
MTLHSHPPSSPVNPTLVEVKDLATIAVKSGLLSPEIRSPEAAVVIILTGMELGLSPMQSLRGIYVVKGRPVLSADLLVALVKRSSECLYFRLVESTHERATYETQRVKEPVPTSITWTIEDARRADLAGRGTWKAHPAAMLRARCAAALARAVYPDLVLGLYEESEGEEMRALPPRPVIVETPRPEPGPGDRAEHPALVLDPPAEIVVDKETGEVVGAESKDPCAYHSLLGAIGLCDLDDLAGIGKGANKALREGLITRAECVSLATAVQARRADLLAIPVSVNETK